MSNNIVTARVRQERGKGPARRLRAEGRIPAVLYGGGKDPISLSLDPSLLVKALDPELKRNTLFNLEVENDAAISCTVMVKDAQIDALKDHLTHVDLIRVSPDDKVEVRIPLILVGRAEGVKLGGVLEQVYREVPVLAPASKIPRSIEVDVTKWELMFQLHAGDMPMAEGIELLLDPKLKVASVSVGRTPEEEEQEEEEGEGEGEGAEAKEGDKEDGDSK